MRCAEVLVAGTLIVWGAQVMDEEYHNYDAPYVALAYTTSLQLHKLNLDAGSGYTAYEGSASSGKKHHYLGTPQLIKT